MPQDGSMWRDYGILIGARNTSFHSTPTDI